VFFAGRGLVAVRESLRVVTDSSHYIQFARLDVVINVVREVATNVLKNKVAIKP